MRRLVSILPVLAVIAALALSTTPAVAGGSWFDTDRPFYAAGDEVTVVGYTGGGAYGWVDDGPFFAWLTGNSGWTDEPTPVDPAFVHYVGPLTLHEHPSEHGVRVSITFTLPDDLVEGIYGINYCNAACDEQIGDLIGGTLYVGDQYGEGRAPQWPGWEPLRTGEPMPEGVVVVGTTPDPLFVPPVPSDDVWWILSPESSTPTSLAATTTTTVVTTTTTTTEAPTPTAVPTSTTTATGATPATETASDDGLDPEDVAVGGLVVGAAAMVGWRFRRDSSG